MRAVLTEQFVRSFITAPPEIQKTFGKQLALFLRDRRHPSLQAKKFDKERWQARVNDDCASTTGAKAARTTFSGSSRTPIRRHLTLSAACCWPPGSPHPMPHAEAQEMPMLSQGGFAFRQSAKPGRLLT